MSFRAVSLSFFAAVRCAPPDNKPLPVERDTCADGLWVGTRGGPRRVGAAADGGYWVDMGPARPFGTGIAGLGGAAFLGRAVSMGNPHLACLTDVDVDTLEVVSRDGEEIGEVGVMFDAAERMATYEDKNTDGGASVKK